MSTPRSLELSQHLKLMRIKKGITQIEVAKCLGYASPQFVSNWERALAAPPIRVLRELVKVYDLDTAYVIELYLQPIRKKLERELRSRIRGNK